MLDILRKKSSSPITKSLLLIIVIVFIFFFGWSSFNGSRNANDAVATVNGYPINQNEVSLLVQNQLSMYEQFYQGKPIPEQTKQEIAQQALNALIEQRLVLQAANKSGLAVSPDEVFDEISKNPNLQEKGVFNADKYKNVYRPWFFNRTGLDYETVVTQEKLISKFKNTFNNAAIISDEELKNIYAVDNTKIAASIITLNPLSLVKDFKPNEGDVSKALAEQKSNLGEAADKIKEEDLKVSVEKELRLKEGKRLANNLANEWWPLFKAGKLKPDVLKKQNSAQRDIPLTALSNANSFFPGAEITDALNVLMTLSPKKTFPDQPINLGDNIYLVKVTDKAEPDWNTFEKEKTNLKNNQIKTIGARLYQSWYESAVSKAKIKISDSAQSPISN